jgi:two-component system, NarL family, nitrate/nitrite response regulator NarL
MKVLLADDHPLTLIGIRRVLEAAEGFEVVGEARGGGEVLTLVGRTRPDVVLLDMCMPGVDGLSCLEQIRQIYPDVKVVVISVSTSPEQIREAFTRGASGYISKSIDPLELVAAVRQGVDGTVDQAVGTHDTTEVAIASEAGLTKRELTILKAVARGLANQAIARELWVTEQTVKFHLTNIYRKLGVSNRTEAARWAYAQGISEASSSQVVLKSSLS